MKVTCPGCRDPKNLVETGTPHFPFCSRECRSEDLDGWASESYRIAGEELTPEEIDGLED